MLLTLKLFLSHLILYFTNLNKNKKNSYNQQVEIYVFHFFNYYIIFERNFQEN